jgi:hypothetical protein
MKANNWIKSYPIRDHHPVALLLLSAALLIAPSSALPISSRDHNHAAAFYRSLPRVNTTCPDRSQWMRDSAWIHNRSLCVVAPNVCTVFPFYLQRHQV